MILTTENIPWLYADNLKTLDYTQIKSRSKIKRSKTETF